MVIGIIALLIGLLLPALQAAQRSARRTACAAQLRNLGDSFDMYLHSQNYGVFPACPQVPTVNYSVPCPGGITVFRPPPVQCVIGGLLPPNTIPTPNFIPPAQDRTAADSWRCPADLAGFTDAYTGRSYASYFAGEGSSYQYNMSLAGDKITGYVIGPPQHQIDLYYILHPEGIWVMADMTTFHGPPMNPNSANVLFADWHVGTVLDISPDAGSKINFFHH